MDLIDYKNMSDLELYAKIDELRSKCFFLIFRHRTVENKDLKEVRCLHKDVARLFTLLNSKKSKK